MHGFEHQGHRAKDIHILVPSRIAKNSQTEVNCSHIPSTVQCEEKPLDFIRFNGAKPLDYRFSLRRRKPRYNDYISCESSRPCTFEGSQLSEPKLVSSCPQSVPDTGR